MKDDVLRDARGRVLCRDRLDHVDGLGKEKARVVSEALYPNYGL